MRVVSEQALIAALDSAVLTYPVGNGSSDIIELRRGSIAISDTITIKGVRGLGLLGHGIGGSVLQWTGAADRPMFRITRTSNVWLGGFRVEAINPLQEVFRYERGESPGGTPYAAEPSNKPTLEALDIDGGYGANGQNIGKVFYARLYDTANDVKNDQVRLLNVRMSGYEVGASLEGVNCTDNLFDHCDFLGSDGPVAAVGVKNGGAVGFPSSFRVIGGQFTKHGKADFDIVESKRGIVIGSGMDSEHSARLVIFNPSQQDGVDLEVGGLTFDGIKWSSSADDIAADFEVGQVYTNGVINVINSAIGAATGVNFKWRWEPPATGRFRFEGNTVRANNNTGNWVGTVPSSVANSLLFRGTAPEAMPAA